MYSNPQRGLECLQRALKLADACTSANPSNLRLFVDILEHYLYFFEKQNPSISGNYITGLVALIKEHSDNMGQFGGVDSSAIGDAKQHFLEIVRHIKKMKEKEKLCVDLTGQDDIQGVSKIPSGRGSAPDRTTPRTDKARRSQGHSRLCKIEHVAHLMGLGQPAWIDQGPGITHDADPVTIIRKTMVCRTGWRDNISRRDHGARQVIQ